MPVTTRFAPSPTGALHLGHVHAALFARRRGERYLVRLEDTDTARCRPDYAAAIMEDLAWLGLAGDTPPRVQSQHAAEYQAALDALRRRGLVFPCFCSRADIARAASAPHGAEAPYPGTCRALPDSERQDRIAAGQPHAWRLHAARARQEAGPVSFHEQNHGRLPADPAPFGDVVLGRRDGAAAYHLAVTHDDALQAITLVTRAIDLQPATAVHRLLQVLMGWPEPGYAHHPLLLDAEGRRLSKRDGAAAVASLRRAGHTPDAVRAMAG